MGLVLAGSQTWAAIRSDSMNADGVSYLDIADAYLRGDWWSAVSSVWSPLYSWVLALTLSAGEGRARELVVVHVTGFAAFLCAYSAFAFLKRELAPSTVAARPANCRPLPGWAWDSVAHLVFLWAALCLITLWAVTPDMLMAAAVLVASALIVRIRRGRGGVPEFALLGVTLGVAYLIKAVMFPLGFVFLIAAWFAAGSRRSGLPRVAIATGMFLLVSGPWIVAVSRHEGKLTFGEAGRITYLRHVNGIPYPHWQGDTPALGRPVHSSRLLLADPPVFEFGSPVGGTYPISYDPAYWYRGAEPRLEPGPQLGAMLSNAITYYDLIAGALGGVLACALLLHMLGPARAAPARDLVRAWALLLPATAALFLYGMVYVEGRYVGVFLVLLLLEVIARIRIRRAIPDRVVAAASVVMIGLLAGNLLVFFARGYTTLSRNSITAGAVEASPAGAAEVATVLRQLGVAEGDAVGVIGYAFDSFWARAAGTRIVAELLGPQAGPLWTGGPEVERRVLDAFAAAGARAVVAENVPAHADLTDWRRVARSNYFVRRLDATRAGG